MIGLAATGGGGLAGGAAAGAAGAGALAGMAALAGPLALVFAGVGAIMGGIGAAQQNRALKKYAKQAQARLNDTITQIRVDRMRSTSQLAREAQTEQGAVLNRAPQNQAVMQSLSVRLAAGVASDQFAINETAERGEKAVEAQKQDVVNNVNSQMKNVAMAALEGAVGMGSGGAVIGGAIDDYNATRQAAKSQDVFLKHGEVMRDYERQIADAHLEGAEATTNYYRNLSSSLEMELGALQFQRSQRTNNTPFRFYSGF